MPNGLHNIHYSAHVRLTVGQFSMGKACAAPSPLTIIPDENPAVTAQRIARATVHDVERTIEEAQRR